ATYSYEGAPQLASADLYDPASHTWSATGSLRTARSGHVTAVLPSGKVLIAGGRDAYGSLTSAELYDLATGTWSTAPTLGQTRHEATATVLPSGKVLVVGGRLLAYAAPRGIEISYPTEKVELYIP
ncbi:Kelch repeat-containing protein, partial [Archangium sp.]|uniref:Kelch repeat-containing protein n=1 Tax=Archangium sp. TaxID=1872627 RepID=UPI002D44D3D4